MPKALFKNGVTGVITRVFLQDTASAIGAGKAGLGIASAGLNISQIADNEATPTTYTAAGSTIETISTLGTFAAPTATKCRFKEVDATNLPGIYEIQIADARWAVSNARSAIVCIQATGVAVRALEVQLTVFDVNASVTQTGDAFARIGAAGAGLTAIGDTRVANLDATISSRTKPADTQARVTLVDTVTTVTGGATASALATVQSDTDDIQTRLPAALVGGRMDSSVGAIAVGVDLSATMKTSVTTAATAATPTVTLAAAAVQAIWDALTSALTTSGSIGKWILDKLDAAISSRLASVGYTAPDNTSSATAASAAASAATDASTLVGRLTAIRAAKLDGLPEGIKKNTALSNFTFYMVDSTTKAAAPGLTVTATRRLDGGSFAPCANAPTDLGLGYYTIDFAAADLNGDMVCVRFSATGADDAGFEAKLSA